MEAGTPFAEAEAMKMLITIKASEAGTIAHEKQPGSIINQVRLRVRVRVRLSPRPTPTPTPTPSPTPNPNPNPDRDQGDLLSSLALKDPSKVKKIAAFEGELAYEKGAEKSETALQAYPNPNPNPNP